MGSVFNYVPVHICIPSCGRSSGKRGMEPSQSSNPTVMVLPDDILCAIISCLPVREAVKTSTLSKRWRYLWASSLADIDFDETSLSRFGAPGHIGGADHFATSRDLLRERSRWLARILNRFIDLHTASKIHTFRIYFPIRKENNEYIDRWVTFALKKQAEKLILDIGSRYLDSGERCTFPLGLLEDGRVSSWLKHLRLSSCILGTVNEVCGLASLKTLSLESVEFADEQSPQRLISSRPLLESLSLKVCKYLHSLIIDASFSRLKHLSVGVLASVVISCPNLISLESSAENICLCDDHGLDSLQLPSPSGEAFSSRGRCYITTLLSQDPSRFASLKSLTFDHKKYTEHELANLFSACPSLERLFLDRCVVSVIPFHHNLKFLDTKVVSFYGEQFKIYCGPNLISLNLSNALFEGTPVMLVNCDGHAFSPSSPSPLRQLLLTGCTSHHSNYAAFKFLLELILGPAGLSDKDILSLLSHCSCLERLSLSGGDSKLRHFKIPFPSHPLKYLELKHNKFLQMIELCSTNLATIELHTTYNVPLRVKKAPRLTRVSIGSWCQNTRDETIRSMKELSVLIPRLDTLTLFLTTSSPTLDEDMLIGLPKFKHLKRLVVILKGPPKSVLWMISLIQIAPKLHTFELHLGNARFEPDEGIYVPNEIEQIKYYHNHLKEVKISGFIGMKYEMEMASYLLKYAASLELMTIEPEFLVYEGDGTWKKTERTVRGFQFIRSWLMKHVSPSTRLVIL